MKLTPENRREFDDIQWRAHDRAVQDVVGEARSNAPVGMTSAIGLGSDAIQGGLRGSITNRSVVRSNNEHRDAVGSAARHAAMREFGGTIRPVRAKFLSWIDPASGERRFAKVVHQRPGGPRQGYRPWLRPAGDRYPEYMEHHLRALGG